MARDRDDAASEPTGGVQSLDAALRVLKELAARDHPTALSELARSCDMPASKTHRYLASFVAAGLVRQLGPSGAYDLGPQALEVGLSALQRHDFVAAASERLPHLTETTGMTALLSVWGPSGPVVVRWERSPSFVVTSLGLGTTLPLLSSSTGRVYIGYFPERLLRRRVDIELEQAARRPELFDDIVLTAEGVAELGARVRQAGYSAVDGRFIPGLVAAAAPILDWEGVAQAVVTLIGTDPRAIAHGSEAIDALTALCAGLSASRRLA